MYNLLRNYFLKAYRDKPTKYRVKASYGLSGMLAGFVFMSIALLSHLFLAPKLHLLVGDFVAIFSLIVGLIFLKIGKLPFSGAMFLIGSLALLFVQTVIADGFFNEEGITHIFHFFQTLALSVISLAIFSLMATRRWQIVLASLSFLALIFLHVYAYSQNPLLDFSGGGPMITIVVLLEFGFGFTAVILAYGLSSDLLAFNEQKSELIERQSGELATKAEELEKRNADLQIFAYSMSHDLKEPLRTVSSFSTLLKREVLKEEINKEILLEYADFAKNGALKMDYLIQNLLTYIKLGADTQAPEWINLKKIIESIKTINLKVLIEENQAQVHFEGDLQVYGIKAQLEQVLQNLISNAIKYRRPDVTPIITIKVTAVESGVYIDVEDNGEGIALEQQDVIFNMFQRVNSHRKNSYSGTGIGLAICRRVIENHEGEISLNSELGKGTTFHLFLPKPPKGKVVKINGAA